MGGFALVDICGNLWNCYKKYNKLLTLKTELNGEKLFCETHE